jgi:RimJ/RimL family protein N-acetyltransferase
MSSSNTPAPADARAFQWIPIRALSQRHRERITQHLLQLDARDRHLRFGFAVSDEKIAEYVAGVDFDRDEVFGVFNRRLQLIATAHLAFFTNPPGNSAEFGVSVLGSHRGRGIGARLFDRAVLEARNRGVRSLVIHALSENTAMLRIARKAGAVVEREGGEAQASLSLPPEDRSSRVEALVENRAAQIDYRMKLSARRLDEWLSTMQELRGSGGESVPVARE